MLLLLRAVAFEYPDVRQCFTPPYSGSQKSLPVAYLAAKSLLLCPANAVAKIRHRVMRGVHRARSRSVE